MSRKINLSLQARVGFVILWPFIGGMIALFFALALAVFFTVGWFLPLFGNLYEKEDGKWTLTW